MYTSLHSPLQILLQSSPIQVISFPIKRKANKLTYKILDFSFHFLSITLLTSPMLSETTMLETVTQYLSSNCFSWRADKIRKQLPKGPTENTFYHKYYVVRKLGSGGYGTVFLVARRSDNKRFAAKIVPQARCRRTTWCTARQVSSSG